MDKISSNFGDKSLFQISFLLVFCFFLFFVNLGKWDLWNPDEPRYAQVAKEMIQRGDWILMHLNGKIYTDKPPLFFWLIGLSSFLWNGFNSFSVRFPSAIFGTLTVLLTFLIGKNLYSSRTGFLSGLILATSIEFAYLATRANIDATLTFFTTASFYCFVKWYKDYSLLPQGERENVGEREDKRSIIIYGFYISMAMATLTKGPVGFILPLLVSLVYLSVQKDWNGLRQMKLLQGMILFIVIVLAWYVPALIKGGRDYFNETIILHTVDRFAKGSSHIRPFYYYFYNFPVDFLPWIFFLPAAIAYGFSDRKGWLKKEFLFLFVWFAMIFIFFSFSKGKRGLYLLPLFPAVSLMVGRWWNDYISDAIKNLRHLWSSIPLYAFIISLLGIGILGSWVLSSRLSEYSTYSIYGGLFLICGGIALFILIRLKYRIAIFFLITGIIACGFFYTLGTVFPLINPYKSARFISLEIISRIKSDEKLLAYGDFVIAPYIYYTGIIPVIEIEKEEELLNLLNSEKRVFCLMKFRDFIQFQKMDGWHGVKLITRRSVGGDDMVLISNK